MDEIWKPIPGYEGLYEASTLGHIRSLNRIGVDGRKIHGRILSEKPNSAGYSMCVLCKDSIYKPACTHRIIAITFLNTPTGDFTVHHKNRIRTDNRVENLEIYTFSDHARHHLLEKPIDNRGTRNGQCKLTPDIVLAIREEYAAGGTLQREIALRYGISKCHVSDIVNKKRWAHI